MPTPGVPTSDLRTLSDQAIARTIGACGRNMSEAARRLGISRNTLYRRLRQLGGDGRA
jgi:transcriptional regulator of acetoin/glycerol metabolism